MLIKIISLNLWHGGRLFDQVTQFLEDQQADIMLFQEVYNGTDQNLARRFQTVSLLKKLLPNHAHIFSPAILDLRKKEGSIENGQLLLSKFPIISSGSIFFDIPFGEYDHDAIQDFTNFPALMQVVRVKIDNRIFKLMNVHGPVNYDGTADTDRRLKMKAAILEQIKNEEPIILSGDFNVRPQTQTIRDIEQKLKNVFKDELITSFNLKRKDLKNEPGFADAVVDMMFVSPKIKILKKSCPQVDVSDHLPLIATLDV
jgi:endonuclease/exonuclease/phosphatase family metal-dependent hydrolase